MSDEYFTSDIDCFVMESSCKLPDTIYEETTPPARLIHQVNGVSVAINQYSYHYI